VRKIAAGKEEMPAAKSRQMHVPAQSSRLKASRAKMTARHSRKPSAVAALRDELRMSEDRFRSLAETVALPILLLSTRFIVRALNREAEQIYGRRGEDLVGKDYFRINKCSRGGGLTRVDLKHVLAGNPARGIEGRLRRPDGTEHVLLWNATRLVDSNSRVLGVIAVAQDITERHRAVDALREREARLSSIISTAPDAIITIDERGLIQSFSNAAEKMFGYAAGEVIGRNIRMLLPSPHKENNDAYLARYLRIGVKHMAGIGREVEAQRKDGSLFPVELSIGETSLGHTRIFTGFIRDITSRAKMEQELRQAQKMEAIGQLTGGLAHDFNNLLTVISGNLELLERRLQNAADREILGEAQEAADLGAKLADRLLAFGRVQSLNPKPVDLSTLVEGMADLLRRTLGETVEIETRLARNLRVTMADPGQVENVLLNLAINARDAMPKGGRLIVETADVEIDKEYTAEYPDVDPGSYVMLAVTDTGSGMSPQVQQHAFEPFFTTKEPGTGSGLGLSTVYGFVKQSGGHVQLYSEPGRGTTVRIYLPARGKGAERAARAPDQVVQEAGDGETVLVVEDDQRVRRVSVRRLKELGYAVIEAGNGPAALEVLERGEPIDLLFTDIVMPGGMTGVDLAREARRWRPELKILFTSGYAGPAGLKDGTLTRHAGWLAKPYNSRQLAAKLRELLRH
jgi:PAS domain S-box-containing protein